VLTSAIGSQRPGALVDDFFQVSLGNAYVHVVVQSCSFVHGSFPHIEFHGTKGSFVKFGMDPQEPQARAGLNATAPEWGVEPIEMSGTLTTTEGNTPHERRIISERGAHETFYDLFFQCITGRGPNPVQAREALSVIKAIKMAWEINCYN
jgi:scyllo-inositol 2-dehydrogenase (NADP+)